MSTPRQSRNCLEVCGEWKRIASGASRFHDPSNKLCIAIWKYLLESEIRQIRSMAFGSINYGATPLARTLVLALMLRGLHRAPRV